MWSLYTCIYYTWMVSNAIFNEEARRRTTFMTSLIARCVFMHVRSTDGGIWSIPAPDHVSASFSSVIMSLQQMDSSVKRQVIYFHTYNNNHHPMVMWVQCTYPAPQAPSTDSVNLVMLSSIPQVTRGLRWQNHTTGVTTNFCWCEYREWLDWISHCHIFKPTPLLLKIHGVYTVMHEHDGSNGVWNCTINTCTH